MLVVLLLDGLTRSRVGGADSVPALGSGGLSLGLIIIFSSTISFSFFRSRFSPDFFPIFAFFAESSRFAKK